MMDIVIIGAGVTGCAIARELSRYHWRIAVLERASDVCEGTSKANSGIVHAGYDAAPGTRKALLNVEGSRRMEELSKELDFPYRKIGSLVLCFREEDRSGLEKLYRQGLENGVEALRILGKEELRELEPNVSEAAAAALYAPGAGIVCPFGLTIALAENAAVNGVEFYLNTEVQKIEKVQEQPRIRENGLQDRGQEENRGGRPYYRVSTNRGVFQAGIVINAAGVYAGVFHNMVSRNKIRILPRKGEYCLMDKNTGNCVKHTLFQLPSKYGKGVLVTPTVHGNLLAGPTAVDVEDPEAVNTTKEGLEELLRRAALSVKALPERQIITSFAGLRAHEEKGDFVLGQPEDAPGFFDAAGIESPGLSCAPAIGKYMAEQVLQYFPGEKKSDFTAGRKGIPNMETASPEERQRLIRENPAYARVICRCETVTEGEILDAIHRPLGATTLDGIKRRTRAGMGRCQAGFCSPGTVEILARELGKDIGEICKNGPGSGFLSGYDKDGVV